MSRSVNLTVIASAVFIVVGLARPPVATASAKYKCGDDSFRSSCEGHGGYRCADGVIATAPLYCTNGHGGAVASYTEICGDGFVDPGEQCDDGENNSDLAPDACRSDCRKAYCGDAVVDSREQCDDGLDNSMRPNTCRPDCTLPVCGDGVVDDGAHEIASFNEACDPADAQAQSDRTGCTGDCRECIKLVDNIEVTSDTLLCRDVFQVADYGDEGVIIVKHPGITVDCAGAVLKGSGVGAGIYVKMCNDVLIKNCTVAGYATGLKADRSQNVQVEVASSDFDDNTTPMELVDSSVTKLYPEIKQTVTRPVAVASAVPKAGRETKTNHQAPRASTSKSHVKAHAAPEPPPTPAPRIAVSRPAPLAIKAAPKPSGRVTSSDGTTTLTLSTTVERVEIYSGSRRIGTLGKGQTFDITRFLKRVSGDELTFHYLDAGGAATVETLKVRK